MTAIFTKYLPRTETKPARIKVWPANGEGIIISKSKLEDAVEKDKEEIRKLGLSGLIKDLSTNEHIHLLAADMLCSKLNLIERELVSGETKDGYVFVFKK